MKRTFLLVLCAAVATGAVAVAGNDPTIQGETREGIQRAMFAHVMDTNVDGVYFIYDPEADTLLRLTFKDVHAGIVRSAGYFVSCADFFDADGQQYDLDFIVVGSDGKFTVVDTIVHKVGDAKREYKLQS